ncbi:cytochrome c oxidase biogenesis protein Cmc1 like-domain-containing protein [Neurospora hispaniola]|uniref:COX assembly mitochondrial protein n=1 Tax=Neurospora hispaniola TaxID=588809 RepID=A0AAJ0IE54_9PEZI|nr:cytochrome c oxidase biogenesis protein Cmc1 like-domain-containing protein [Neurospora hispaniola]
MHPLLHTKDNAACYDVMVAFEECHARGFLWKSMGMCNELKEELAACLRAERFKTQKINQSSVADKKAIIRQKWKEIDENS